MSLDRRDEYYITLLAGRKYNLSWIRFLGPARTRIFSGLIHFLHKIYTTIDLSDFLDTPSSIKIIQLLQKQGKVK